MCCDTLLVNCVTTHHSSNVPRHTICQMCCDTPYVGCAAAQCVDCAVAHLFITTDFRIMDLQVGSGKIHWNSRFINVTEDHTFLSTAVDTRKSTVTFSFSFWPTCSQFSSSWLVLRRMPRLLIIPVWGVLLGLELYIMEFRNIENWLGASGNWRVLSVGRSTVNLIVHCDDERRTWGP